MLYEVITESEIERIGRSAFEIARKRSGRLCSVDKANVLECSELWREVMAQLGHEYNDVELSHMHVDNAAMHRITSYNVCYTKLLRSPLDANRQAAY